MKIAELAADDTEGSLAALAERARRVPPDDIEAALTVARAAAPAAAGLGRGATGLYLATLATLGSVDLTVARVVEPHLDALAILAQAPPPVALDAIGVGPEATWGVYAAAAPGRRVEATAPSDGRTAWVLDGRQPWCSLADRLDAALLVAHDPRGAAADAPDGDDRRLYAVPLRHPGVEASGDPWAGRGLVAVTSGGIDLDGVPAVPVGPVGWYLSRPGFAWGAVGVAAVWFGAACTLRDTLLASARRRRPDQIALMHAGTLDALLHAAGLSLRDAAARIDAGEATGQAGALLAARVRAVVAHAAEEAIRIVGHALGPGPLVGDADHARRIADLTVYLRQHHAERDLARLGDLLLPDASA